MKVILAFVSGIFGAALLANTMAGCSYFDECSHAVDELAPGSYRLSGENDTPNDANYELVYSKDDGTVIETLSRAGRAVRNEYTASPPE